MLRYYIYALIVLVIDQITKWMIVKNMAYGESISVIGDFFMITSHRNRGAAFGILQNQRWFFIVITIVVVIGIVWYLRKAVREGQRLLPLALSLILGGAVGNFVDRALFGEVVDFLDFRFTIPWPGEPFLYNYPIFNVADSGIVVGVALIFLDSFLGWRNESKQKGSNLNESKQESGEA
jgi:signal peptidase II